MPKITRTDGRYRPFRELQRMLESKKLPLKSPEPGGAAPRFESAPDPDDPVADEHLFRQAMDGVIPLQRGSRRRVAPKPPVSDSPRSQTPELEAAEQLHRLVATGEGFQVSDTPEYREGVGRNVPQGITRHLHKGQFSIQDDIDLHGLSAVQAGEALQSFFKETVASGKRAVLIVHGRGLSSPDKPVLKALVHRWLETGPWRHWVMAYSSARACDGGAGGSRATSATR